MTAQTENVDSVELPADLVSRLRQARQQIATWQEIADEAQAELKELLGEHESGTVDGCLAIRWTHVKTQRLDQTLLKETHPDAYQLCQTTTTSRRFTLTGGDDS